MLTTWENIYDLKHPHPVHTDKYAVSQGIYHETEFHFWVYCLLKKRDWIVDLVKKSNVHFFKQAHKFGIEFPKNVEEVHALDEKYGNTIWLDYIYNDMKDFILSFYIMEDYKKPLVGYKQFGTHMDFVIKI